MDATYVVRLFPKEFCSCLLKKDCQHIVALKISLGMEVSVYATANAVSILHGLYPRNIIYKLDHLRAHLLQCMTQGHFKPFPHNEVLEFDPESSAMSGFEEFCSCRMPEDGLMFECSGCEKWFHPEHQNVSNDDMTKRIVKCLKCKDKTKSKKPRRR